MEPVIRPLFTAAAIAGKTVVSMEIAETDISRRPCFYQGGGRLNGSYIRAGDADRKMTEYEVYSFEAWRKKIQDELRLVEHAAMDDLSTGGLEEFMLHLRRLKPNLAGLPAEKMLRLQGLARQGNPTLAGILLFADYPQSFFPGLCVTAVSVPGTEMGVSGEQGERFIDNQRIEGTLPQMLEEALRFVRRNNAVRTIIDPMSGRRNDKAEYPQAAIREIILNALIHRDYSIHTDTAPITIQIYRDRLVVENPGGLYGRLSLDTLGAVSADTRNPFLAGAMEILGLTENRFSGIPTIRGSMKDHGLPPPLFEDQKGIFRVTLFNGIPRDTTVYKIRGGYVSEAEPFYDALPIEEAILEFCKTPRSRRELARRFPQLTQIYLMTAYVNPLVSQGRLRLSLPETPKSKRQRFTAIPAH
jgi:ATP-dependent DNA helicase RecG